MTKCLNDSSRAFKASAMRNEDDAEVTSAQILRAGEQNDQLRGALASAESERAALVRHLQDAQAAVSQLRLISPLSKDVCIRKWFTFCFSGCISVTCVDSTHVEAICSSSRLLDSTVVLAAGQRSHVPRLTV